MTGGGGQSEWVDEEMNVSRLRLIVQQQTHCNVKNQPCTV